ncbi:unnamed protein product [Scytosiphon promiscuus]
METTGDRRRVPLHDLGFENCSQLYRDCLRLVDHIASKSPKGQQLRLILRNEFKKNMSETDPVKIEALKGGAIRGLSNYLVHESGSNDPQLKKRMDAVKTHALADLKQREQAESEER